MQHRTTPTMSMDDQSSLIANFASYPAPQRLADRKRAPADEIDEEAVLRARALDGDVEALMRWRQLLDPVDYDELGWGD